MAEHRVPKGNIIYIIPTDELFIKYKNNEAFIDEYGRLMNRKPHGEKEKIDFQMHRIILFTKAVRGLFWT